MASPERPPFEELEQSVRKFVLLGDACHATVPYLQVMPFTRPFHSSPELTTGNRAQGASQAFEDGAVLGSLLDKIKHPSQLKDCVTIYETIRKPRARAVVDESMEYQNISHMSDGPRQDERDRQLLHEEPFEGYPNKWADPLSRNCSSAMMWRK